MRGIEVVIWNDHKRVKKALQGAPLFLGNTFIAIFKPNAQVYVRKVAKREAVVVDLRRIITSGDHEEAGKGIIDFEKKYKK